MKKTGIFFTLFIFFTAVNSSFADVFDKLDNLTQIQKQQIAAIQQEYTKQNNELENMISSYNNGLIRLKADLNSSDTIIPLGIGIYEKKIQDLKSRQGVLANEADKLYKKILTSNQYREYQTMQLYLNNAFSSFLQK